MNDKIAHLTPAGPGGIPAVLLPGQALVHLTRLPGRVRALSAVTR